MKMISALILMLAHVVFADVPTQHFTFRTVSKPVKRSTGFLGFPKGWEKKANWHKGLPMGVKLPDVWDWRNEAKKGLTPIMDQGQCGSCWAFSSVGAFQDKIAIQEEKIMALSTQEALSCSRAGSCNGGYFNVMDFFIDPGSALASDWPYAGRDLRCKKNLPKAAKLASWTFIGAPNRSPTIEEIKSALYTSGPVVVTITANYPLMAYKSGVFNGCTNGGTNHMVVIEGWGNGYWIVRNSWSASWGEKGFFRIKFGCSRVGEVAAYLTLP